MGILLGILLLDLGARHPFPPPMGNFPQTVSREHLEAVGLREDTRGLDRTAQRRRIESSNRLAREASGQTAHLVAPDLGE